MIIIPLAISFLPIVKPMLKSKIDKTALFIFS